MSPELLSEFVVAWIEPAIKAVAYLAMLAAIGTPAARLVVARASSPDASADDAGVRLDRLGRSASLVLVVALFLRAWAHTVAAFGLTDSLEWSNLTLIAFESRWGESWRLQTLASAALCVVALVALATRSRAWRSAFALCILLVAVAWTGAGHSASTQWLRFAHTLHIVGAGAWAGTLVVLLFTVGRHDAAAGVRAFRAFAPLAMAGVGALAATGLVAAVRYVGSPTNLGGSDYGRWLLGKSALVAAMLLLGAHNWRTLRRPGTATTPRSVLAEAWLAVVVVLVTAALTETAHP